MKYRLNISDDGIAELARESDDEIIWCSDDDEDFWDDDDDKDTDADEIVDYLVRKGIVESANDVTEVVDESGEYPSLDMDGELDDGKDAETVELADED